MFSAIRRRIHVTPSTIIATFALVFAMTGGAYAANKYLITSTKQISPKVLKALRGASGKAGANGANGVQGPAGPGGPQGPAGASGKEGALGKEGPAGKNGENGKNGTTGFTETLPKDKTETGMWTFSAGGAGLAVAPISFAIPLASTLDAKHVHYVNNNTVTAAQCPGTLEKPEALPGNLCVWENFVPGQVNRNEEKHIAETEIFPDGGGPPILAGTLGAGTTGAGVAFVAKEQATGFGTWAVTAP
jgi:hypothetical protein